MLKHLVITFIILVLSILQANARPTPYPNRSTPIDTSGWNAINERAQTARVLMLDENYKKGQAIYRGKGKYKKYAYCVPNIKDNKPEQRVPLKRRSMLAFKKMAVTEFVKQLYDCNQPEKWVLNYLDKKDAGYTVYYLNKQYKLDLTQ